ncbi:MAG: RNA polymerase sigma-70 factor [Candidatus Cyclobacteriaceae bacterium M3_2C_046]
MSQTGKNFPEFLLISQIKKGDKKAFEQIFETYHQRLFYSCMKFIHDEEEAREIVQEVFFKVWHYRENMDPNLSLPAYLITIAKRLIFNKAKRKLHEQAYQKHYISHSQQTGNTVDDYINYQELSLQINKTIELLPPKRKEIFILSRLQGLSNKEIAEKLNTSVSTVENQMNKALKFLRKNLNMLSLIIFWMLTR